MTLWWSGHAGDLMSWWADEHAGERLCSMAGGRGELLRCGAGGRWSANDGADWRRIGGRVAGGRATRRAGSRTGGRMGGRASRRLCGRADERLNGYVVEMASGWPCRRSGGQTVGRKVVFLERAGEWAEGVADGQAGGRFDVKVSGRAVERAGKRAGVWVSMQMSEAAAWRGIGRANR